MNKQAQGRIIFDDGESYNTIFDKKYIEINTYFRNNTLFFDNYNDSYYSTKGEDYYFNDIKIKYIDVVNYKKRVRCVKVYLKTDDVYNYMKNMVYEFQNKNKDNADSNINSKKDDKYNNRLNNIIYYYGEDIVLHVEFEDIFTNEKLDMRLIEKIEFISNFCDLL